MSAAPRTDRLSPQVWQRLDPEAGALPPRTRRLAVAAVLTATVVAGGLGAAWWSGLVRPAYETTGTSGWSADGDARTVRMTFDVRSTRGTVDVVDVRADLPGLRLVDVAGVPSPSSAGGATLTLTWRVTDCAAAPRQADVAVRTRMWWGTATTQVPLPVSADASAPVDAPDEPVLAQALETVCG